METKIIARHTKCYSELPPFQRARKTEYLLYQTDGELRLAVKADTEPPRAAECVLKGADCQTGCALLQLLYENAVEADTALDVIRDLCAAL